MTPQEVLNILDKIGINASSERFTQESFEYENPFYEFDDFNIGNIEKKFMDYCYKKRTTGLYMLNEDEQIVPPC